MIRYTARRQLLGDQDVATTGGCIELPASLPEVCAICNTRIRNLGKPGYFITFTANPNWEEIQAELLTDRG
jgi:hypothetical protein